MNNNIIFVDDDRLTYESVSDLIEASNISDFKIKKYIKQPAPRGDFANGPLMTYLKTGIEKTPDTYIVMLDIRFGDQKDEETLGIEMARYLIDEFGLNERVKILCMTNYDNRLYFDDLYRLGVRVFIFKPELEHTLIAALKAALNDKAFIQGYTPGADVINDAQPAPLPIGVLVPKMIAKGYSNRSLKNGGYPAVDAQKSAFKRETSLPFLAYTKNLRLPGDNDWNDVYFLLYFLSQRDRETIDYVEQVCKIKISVPT